MKLLMKALAYFLHWLGHITSIPAYKYDNWFGHKCFDWYQKFMGWSSDVQDRFKLDGPWHKVKE
jgi:hypothetical protein